MAQFTDDESIVLVELLGGNCTWEAYKKKCATRGLAPSRFLVCGMLRLVEAHMEGEQDVQDDSIVALTERGKSLAERVKQVRDIFCDPPVASPPPRRRRGRIRQGELFPPTN